MKTLFIKYLLFFYSLGICITYYANSDSNLSISVDGFIENKGQIIDQNGNVNQEVLFLLPLDNFNVLIRKDGFSYEFKKVIDSSITKSQHLDKFQKNIYYDYDYNIHRIDFDFIGSNSSVEVINTNRQKTTFNYYTYGTSEQGVVGVNCYENIRLNNIYDGVDIEFIYQKSTKSFKYNIYADTDKLLDKIKFKISGAENRLDEGGNIEVETILGTITEVIPYSEGISIDNDTSRLDISFINQTEDIYGVSLNQPFEGKVIIDPVPTLVWATYYGGTNDDWGYSLVKDSLDFFYMCGDANSPNNIATSGAHQTTIGSAFTRDGFIAKFDSTSQLIWGTYMGGNEYEFIYDIDRIDNNNIIVSGTTRSTTNIATIGAYQTVLQGLQDAFLSKFTNNGVLVWSTYFGGETNFDNGYTVACGNSNDIYMAGLTQSTTLISTAGTYQTVQQGMEDGFLAKFDDNGNFLAGTYFGGTQRDWMLDLTINSNNEIIFSGLTTGSSGLALNALHQTNYGGGSRDGVYGKFDSNLNLLWSNYFGGASDDIVCATTIGLNDTIYMMGFTSSVTNIATVGAYQTVYGGGFHDSYVAKVNTNGSIVWSSYIGGTDYDELYQIKYHPINGHLYLCGYSYSQTGFATANAWQPSVYNYPNSHDAALVKYSTNGSLIWATYFGGEADDEFYDLEFDSNGDIYLTGQVLSDTNISTPGVYQDTLGNASWADPDSWLVRFTEETCPTLSLTISSNSPLCENDTLILLIDTGYNYSWSGPNGYSNTTDSDTLYQVSELEEGLYNCVVSDSVCNYVFQHNVVIHESYSDTLFQNICQGDTFVFDGNPLTTSGIYNNNFTSINSCDSVVYLNLSVVSLPNVSAGNDTTICIGDTIQLQSVGANSYNWTPSSGLSDTTISNPLAMPTYTTSYFVTGTDSNSCVNSDTIVISVNPLPSVTISNDTSVCSGVSVQLSASGGNTYSWAPSSSLNNSTISNPIASPTNTTMYYVTTIDTNGCSNNDSLTINVNPIPSINAGNDTSICIGDSIQLQATGGVSYTWSPSTGLSDSTIANPTSNTSTNITYFLNGIDANQCIGFDSVIITINPLPTISAGLNDTVNICTGDSVQLTATGGVNYIWTPNTDISNNTVANPLVYPVNSTIYYVIGSDVNSCVNFDSIVVDVQFMVKVPDTSITICNVDSFQLSVNGPPGASYSWTPSTSLSNPNISNPYTYTTTSIIYTVVIQNTNGCIDTVFYVVNNNGLAVASFSVETSPTCDGIVATYNNTSTGAVNYLWSFSDGTQSTSDNPTHTFPFESEIITVLNAYSVEGCVDTISMTFNSSNFEDQLGLLVPDVFTPNNDDYNNEFRLDIPETIYPCVSLTVYNRWGMKIFEADGQNIGWNGKTTAGADVPEGTYFYIIGVNGLVKKGSVTLLR